MKVTTKETTDTSTTLLVVVDAKEIEKSKAKALKQFGKSVKAQGFRKGKAPAKVVEQQVDPNELSAAVLNDVVPVQAGMALEQKKILTAIQPDVTVTKFVPYSELEIEIKAEFVANVKLMDYKKKITKAKPKVDVTDEEVENVQKRIQFDMSERKEVDRAAKLDDQVWIDFSGTDKDGKEVDGASGEDYPLALGSNTFIPGFEDELVGVKTGDEKKFDVTFPKDYQAEKLAGAKVTFKVTVKKVQEVIIPEINDGLAKQVGPYKDAQELLADIRTKVEEDKVHKAEMALETEIVNEIAEGSTMDIPDKMIDMQTQAILEEHQRNLQYQGTTYEAWLESESLTPESHGEQMKETAEKRVRGGIVLSEVAKAEGVEVTDDEITQAMEQYKAQYASDPQMQMELAKPDARRDIAARLLTGRTLDKLKELILK
ncbi:MAG: trigger factor [Patescibacteria group bacterium]